MKKKLYYITYVMITGMRYFELVEARNSIFAVIKFYSQRRFRRCKIIDLGEYNI